MSGESNDKPSNHINLYVKAGIDGERYGGSLQCQRVFMVMLLKAQTGQLQFTVTTINQARPPETFRKIAHRLPCAVHQHRIMEDPDEIVQYLDINFPDIELGCDSKEAEVATQNIFSKFTFYLKEISKDPSHLVNELRKLDHYLQNKGTAFLCGDAIMHLDCTFLPKLHHLRIALFALKHFEIPPDLTHVWNYLGNAYKTDAFRKACPSDQEIVIHWASRSESPKLNHAKEAALLAEEPKFSFDTPV